MLKSLTSTLAVIATAAAVALAAPLAASAQSGAAGAATLSASPASIAVGETSTITADGLGGLETAYFGLDGTPGGQLAPEGSTDWTTSVDAPASDGKAVVEFSATEAGTFTVAVSDGETPIATTTVTVTAGGGGGGGGDAPTVTAGTASIAVGDTTTVTAEGLGGLETAFFGLGGTGTGGQLAAAGTTAWSTSVEVPVSDGRAVVEFSATAAGSYVVDVTDGETPLAQATITVTDAATPTPSPTVTPTPASGEFPVALAVIITLAVLLVAAIVVIIVVASRRRGAKDTTPPPADVS